MDFNRSFTQTQQLWDMALYLSESSLAVLDVQSGQLVYASKQNAQILGIGPDSLCSGWPHSWLNELTPHARTQVIDFADETEAYLSEPVEITSLKVLTFVYPLQNDTWIKQQHIPFYWDEKGRLLTVLLVFANITHLPVPKEVTHYRVALPSSLRIARAFAPQRYAEYKGITGRQMQILELIGHGLNSTQIAKRLGISAHTVDKHRKNLFEVTQTRNIGELMEFALREMVLLKDSLNMLSTL